MATPRVSVITPVHNDAAFIGDAIRSVRAQTLRDWEMIVVDDGSTDGSAEAARAAAEGDARVRVLSIANGGVSRARNVGLAQARGRAVHFLDSDDWIAPNALTQLSALLAARPGAALAAASYASADEQGRPLETFRTPAMPDPVSAFARTCVFPIHAALTRIEEVRAVGGFDPTLPACEDWDMWLRIAKRGGAFAHAPDVLATYRRRAGSLTRDSLRMARAVARVIPTAFNDDDHWEMIDALMASLFYIAGGAIALDHDIAPLWAELPDLEGWSFDASVAAYAVIGGMAYALSAGADTPSAIWPIRRVRAATLLAALAARIGHPRDCDLLFAHVEARLLGPRAFQDGWTSSAVEAGLLDLAKDDARAALAGAGAKPVQVRAVHKDGAALGSLEAPRAETATPALLRLAAREWPIPHPADLGAALVAHPVWAARQILARQPPRLSRAALAEAARAAATRIRAARISRVTPSTGAGRALRGAGAPTLRLPILTARRGDLAHAVALVDALAAQQRMPISVGAWIDACTAGLPPRSARFALALDAALAPEDHPAWAALAARGVAPLILAPLTEAPAPGWSWAGLRTLVAQGAQLGWSAPRDLADLDEAGELAARAAAIVDDLSTLAGQASPIAALAAGGGSRFAVERLRLTGFAGALGRLVGVAHLDDSPFDLRRTPIDLDAPLDQLVRIVTDA